MKGVDLCRQAMVLGREGKDRERVEDWGIALGKVRGTKISEEVEVGGEVMEQARGLVEVDNLNLLLMECKRRTWH